MPAKRVESLLVCGGVVINAWGRVRADLAVSNGKIVDIAMPGRLAGAHKLDANGLFVLPGLVDAHVHVRDPGFTHKEDFASASRAAAVSGITTMLVMPYDDPVASSTARLTEKATLGAGRSLVDYALLGGVGSLNVDAIGELVAAGAVSVEVQLADGPSSLGTPDLGTLYQIMLRAQAAKTVLGVYCEEESIVSLMVRSLRERRRLDAQAAIDSKPPFGEVLSAASVLALGHETHAAVHLRQISTLAALNLALASRANGDDVTVEVTPHHLYFTAEDPRSSGPGFRVAPPLRSKTDRDALAAAACHGDIDVLASDHAPHAPDEKARGQSNIWAEPSGLPGLETFLPAAIELFGWDNLETLVSCCCDVPARRFGLGDRKGRLQIGYDADLVLLDPSASWRVDVNRLETKAKASPFANHVFPGQIRYTLLRGEIVSTDRSVCSEPMGSWLRPSTSSRRIGAF